MKLQGKTTIMYKSFKSKLEILISGIIKNSGPRTFEQIFKNLHFSYQINISENKLKDSLGKMILVIVSNRRIKNCLKRGRFIN